MHRLTLTATALASLTLLAAPKSSHPLSGEARVLAQSAAGTLILRNVRWERVVVEARIGTSTDCAANAAIGTRTLLLNQSWAFVADGIICWRREQVPSDRSRAWTSWSQARAPAATRRQVQL